MDREGEEGWSEERELVAVVRRRRRIANVRQEDKWGLSLQQQGGPLPFPWLIEIFHWTAEASLLSDATRLPLFLLLCYFPPPLPQSHLVSSIITTLHPYVLHVYDATEMWIHG